MIVTTDLNSQQLSAASRLFSPSVFKELTAFGESPILSRLLKELLPVGLVNGNSQVRDLFDSVFDILKLKAYRNERIYKTAITNKILLGKHSLNTAILLEEFRVEKCKADVVVLNGTSNVYEIKSERDSLRRLENQVNSYKRVFANVNVIVGENHLDSVVKTTPTEIGILLLSDRFQISTIRESRENLECIDPALIFDSIQVSEAKHILNGLKIPTPNVPNTKMYMELREVFAGIPKEIVHQCMIETLKQKRSQKKLSTFLDAVPKSIIANVISTRIGEKDQARLIHALNTPIQKAIDWE